MSAVISDCGNYRYRLDRDIQEKGLTFAYFGINPSTADANEDDQTIRKLKGFTLRNGGRKFIIGNPFGLRSTSVRRLSLWDDPIGLDNDKYLNEIIKEANILIPCWGNTTKISKNFRYRFEELKLKIFESNKPVLTFGLTVSGNPKHPLMLGYNTQLIEWKNI